MLQVKRASQVTFLHSDLLDRIPGVVHAFSTRRADGYPFSLGPFSSSNPLIQINRARFLAAIGAPGWPILKLRQVHSGIVRFMQDTSAAGDPVEADAAVTSLRGALVAVQTADCVPILIAERSGSCIAAIHAGWRGTAAGIVANTVSVLERSCGLSPADLIVSIGPHIGVCCYEIGTDVLAAFPDAQVFEKRPEWAKPHLNLDLANRKQLSRMGIPENQIDSTQLCTNCRSDLFFSYRREGDQAGRLLSVIGIQP